MIKGQYDDIHISDSWISLLVFMMAPWVSSGSLGMGLTPHWTNRTVTTQLGSPLYLDIGGTLTDDRGSI